MRETEHGISQYPDWRCKSCHAEYPSESNVVRCTKKRGKSICRGQLHRFMKYEVKKEGVFYPDPIIRRPPAYPDRKHEN